MQVKLCGFTDEVSVNHAILCGADFLGFVFHQDSVRYIAPKNAKEISKTIPQSIAKVAVTVNESFKNLEEIAKNLSPDFFQLHGLEDINYVKTLKKNFPQIKIIKALCILNKVDLDRVREFENIVDLFLFDTYKSGSFGGTGIKFDWNLLKDFHCKKDWFLSGGININNVDGAFKIKAKLLDISSGIEEIRGVKSLRLITELMTKIRVLSAVTKNPDNFSAI